MRKTFLAAALGLTCAGAHAGGFVFTGGFVFDPSNFAQNTVKAAKAVEAGITQAQQYAAQIQQYEAQVRQLATINPAALQSLGGGSQASLADVNRYISSLQTVQGDLNNVTTTLNNRFTEAQLSGQTWNQYVASQRDQINSGVQAAQIRAQNEASTLRSVQQDYALAQEWQARIPVTQGSHEAFQLMNTQLNRVILQNAEVIKQLQARQGILQAQRDVDKLAAKSNASVSDRDTRNKMQRDMSSGQAIANGLR